MNIQNIIIHKSTNDKHKTTTIKNLFTYINIQHKKKILRKIRKICQSGVSINNDKTILIQGDKSDEIKQYIINIGFHIDKIKTHGI